MSDPRWSLIPVKSHTDPRGTLSAINEPEFPWPPKRTYWIYDVPAGMVRGAHAHRDQEQLLVCISGRLEVPLDDGVNRATVVLDDPRTMLRIGRMVWSHQKALDPDTRWLFIASGAHDPGEYINSHEVWQRDVKDFRP